jgi:uncharacterized membrane-anchored protein
VYTRRAYFVFLSFNSTLWFKISIFLVRSIDAFFVSSKDRTNTANLTETILGGIVAGVAALAFAAS